ncbi:MAG: hypothetical protein QN860_08075 [Nitrososphaeraceae archaeon]|jgi:hypothetical protein|nr:hypothetical protein [Nitrososphaeraceae archaeon]
MPNEEAPPDYANRVKLRYKELLEESATLFPKVDQRLLIDILKFETTYKDWEGSVMLKILYPSYGIDIDRKKDWIYSRYQRVPSIEENRTLRVKLIRMYLKDLESLLADDSDIEYVTGSATLAPTDAYAA